MPRDDSAQLEARHLVGDACARNLPIDLQFEGEDGLVRTARCRMLAMTDGEVFLDEPHAIGSDTHLGVGDAVSAYFVVGETRYTFDATISRRRVSVMLNKAKRVAGVVITMPKAVVESQRRNDYRVSLIHRDPVHMDVHELDRDADTAPIDALRLQATAVNLSAGGVALTVPADPGRRLDIADELCIAFHLDGDGPEPYSFRGQVRQTRAIAEGTAFRLGVQFLSWPDERTFRRQQDRLRKFLSRAERERLRRAG